jgi:hypothetical protein
MMLHIPAASGNDDDDDDEAAAAAATAEPRLFNVFELEK